MDEWDIYLRGDWVGRHPMNERPPIPDGEALNKEFEEVYQEFVSQGGLDRTSANNEDLEREIRRQSYCVHSMPRQRCSHCRVPIKPYMPNANDR